ncbi:MAG: hypothetical protein RIM84_03720 [Alphaproteobacteria bacterium]
MATPVTNSVSSTGDPLIDGLHQGSSWQNLGATPTITYSLWDNGLGNWTSERAALVDFAFGLWEAVIDVSFERVAPEGATAHNNPSDISIIFASPSLFQGAPNAPAMSMYPDSVATDAFFNSIGADPSDFPTAEGDIYINSDNPEVVFNEPGSVGFQRLMQEIGSAIGLKDPGASDGSFGTYASLGVGQFDSAAVTVMSNNTVSDTDAAGQPATLMMLDIDAAQSIYGANPSHNPGDDVYPLTTAGIVGTIWETGGFDFISAQGQTGSWTISLLQGGVSTSTGNPLSAYNAVVIAEGVEIEAAIGSSQNDNITGNELNNFAWGLSGDDSVAGGDGDDRLFGNPGDDILIGGDGDDTIRAHTNDDTLTGGDGDDNLFGGGNNDFLNGMAGNDQVNGNSGADTVLGEAGNDTLRGQGAADHIEGGAGNDLIVGHAGADTMFGGDGTDTLIGGPANDVLNGGAGPDTFVFGDDQALDTIQDYEAGIDTITVTADSVGDLVVQSGPDGAVVTWGALTTVIVFSNLAPGDIDFGDFLFV